MSPSPTAEQPSNVLDSHYTVHIYSSTVAAFDTVRPRPRLLQSRPEYQLPHHADGVDAVARPHGSAHLAGLLSTHRKSEIEPSQRPLEARRCLSLDQKQGLC